MAHSNRQKLRDARGGKTRHQDEKSRRYASRSTFDASTRIRELESWQKQRDEDRTRGGRPNEVVAKRHINMWESTVERRKSALARLEFHLDVANKVLDSPHSTDDAKEHFQGVKVRVYSEMKILKARI